MSIKWSDIVKDVGVWTKYAIMQTDGTIIILDDNIAVSINIEIYRRGGTRKFGPIVWEIHDNGFVKIVSQV